jgi:hypothetical protein
MKRCETLFYAVQVATTCDIASMEKKAHRRKPYITRTLLRGDECHLLVVPATASATGKMRREYFKTERDAERALKNLEAAIMVRGKTAAAAPALLVNDALKSRSMLDQQGVSRSISEIVADWLTLRAKQNASVTVKAAVSDWLNSPRRQRRERTQTDLRRLGERFMEAFGEEIFCNLQPTKVVAFLDKFSTTPAGFNGTMHRLGSLFRHAERRGWCPLGLVRAINQPKTVAAKGHDVETLSFQ